MILQRRLVIKAVGNQIDTGDPVYRKYDNIFSYYNLDVDICNCYHI